MKKIIVLLAVVLSTGAVMAQSDYKSALGGRFAPGSYYDFLAGSYKTFITDAGALEVNAGAGSKRQMFAGSSRHPFTLSASVTNQHHFQIPVQGLRWFVGGGLTALNVFHSNKDVRGFGFGFYPTGGIDYKIPGVPLNLSADYRPTIFLSRTIGDSFEAGLFGLSVRYAIGE